MMESKKNWSFDFIPGDHNGFIIHFSDKTGENRTPKELSHMIERMNEIANGYDFSINSWGNDRHYIRSQLFYQWWKSKPVFESDER